MHSSPGWGSIKRSHEPGKYGTNMLRYHPRYYDNYQVHDRDIRETCCTVGLCDIFYNRRPQQNCNGYRPPPWSEFIRYHLYSIDYAYVHYVCACA